MKIASNQLFSVQMYFQALDFIANKEALRHGNATHKIALYRWIFHLERVLFHMLMPYNGFIATTNSNNYRYFSIPFELFLIILFCLWAHICLVRALSIRHNILRITWNSLQLDWVRIYFAGRNEFNYNRMFINLNNWFDVGVKNLHYHIPDLAKSCTTIHIFIVDDFQKYEVKGVH